jgi:hypothetical protein
MANCPACWDPIVVPHSASPFPTSESHSEPKSKTPLEDDVHRTRKLITIGLSAFIALMFLSCGGCLALKSMLGPEIRINKPEEKDEFGRPRQPLPRLQESNK